jgi:hypothetical protein
MSGRRNGRLRPPRDADRSLRRADSESTVLVAHGYREAARNNIEGHANLGRLGRSGHAAPLAPGARAKEVDLWQDRAAWTSSDRPRGA